MGPITTASCSSSGNPFYKQNEAIGCTRQLHSQITLLAHIYISCAPHNCNASCAKTPFGKLQRGWVSYKMLQVGSWGGLAQWTSTKKWSQGLKWVETANGSFGCSSKHLNSPWQRSYRAFKALSLAWLCSCARKRYEISWNENDKGKFDRNANDRNHPKSSNSPIKSLQIPNVQNTSKCSKPQPVRQGDSHPTACAASASPSGLVA